MKNLKYFDEFINETYLDNIVDAKVLDYDKKKMKKNGYIEVSLLEPIESLKKGDTVLTSSTEFGQLDDDAFVTCYNDKDEILIPKKILKVEID